MTPQRLRKIALYLKYIAFVIDEEIKPHKTKLSQQERNRRISEGLRLAHARKKGATDV